MQACKQQMYQLTMQGFVLFLPSLPFFPTLRARLPCVLLLSVASESFHSFMECKYSHELTTGLSRDLSFLLILFNSLCSFLSISLQCEMEDVFSRSHLRSRTISSPAERLQWLCPSGTSPFVHVHAQLPLGSFSPPYKSNPSHLNK